ncbi:D-sedoheptulose-7-phosphate isomerase [Thalassomonas actiniarum]|uniref:SIS domain-containing protein n=1 Tax=Thalassomonas actiniarum TaxID=485447 RepID=A0AAE9YTK6_9GAMM|nr:SIS domain-containing protein [Thalassomonas actiniarum]WDE00956.1 SIS domain-containing protein [Thalassomonas actiniarum]
MSNSDNKSTLDSLYPFLADKKADPDKMNLALINSITNKVEQHQDVISGFFNRNAQLVVDCANAIAQMYKKKGSLFTIGNGGSSCDASHVAVEFLHPVTTGRPALPAFDLSCDKTLMTAIANDVGYENVYSRQVANLLGENDALIGISTSGNSDNLIRAFAQAQKNGAVTIGLAGGNGGDMAKMGLDYCLVVDSDSIHRTQECHVAIYHVLWDLVHTLLADDRGFLTKKTKTN